MEVTYFKRHWAREKNLCDQVNREPGIKRQDSRKKRIEKRE
jgi:hypothetical protein